jgi:IS6 family transposase
VYRAVDQHGQVVDVYVSAKRDSAAARAFFEHAITSTGTAPVEVVTDRAPVYPKLIGELFPAAWHHRERYGNNRIEADHGQLKRRLRPMRHLRNDRTAVVIMRGHAFVQNMRRGHYRLTAGVPARLRLVEAFDELSHAI